MSYLTIPSVIKDPCYIYKMRKMILHQQRRCLVKTNISNIEDLAVDLRVPSKSILKFMCAELEVHCEGTSILNGLHSYNILLETLDKFINMYILCPNCNLPEIKHFVQVKDLMSKCNACGKTNSHNGKHKSGKALIIHFKQEGE